MKRLLVLLLIFASCASDPAPVSTPLMADSLAGWKCDVILRNDKTRFVRALDVIARPPGVGGRTNGVWCSPQRVEGYLKFLDPDSEPWSLYFSGERLASGKGINVGIHANRFEETEFKEETRMHRPGSPCSWIKSEASPFSINALRTRQGKSFSLDLQCRKPGTSN